VSNAGLKTIAIYRSVIMEIENYPDYQIYEDGRVFSKHTRKFLKHRVNGGGYLYVSLFHKGEGKNHYIHRLVSSYYIPNPENRREVDHIDRNKKNNHVSNLRWATRSDNNQNKMKYSTNKSGHKCISYHKTGGGWVYQKTLREKNVRRYFKTKTDALCFKYIQLLKNLTTFKE